MNLSAIRTWSIIVVIVAAHGVRADDGESASASGLSTLWSTLEGKTWATLSDQGGFQLRLLTEDEKRVAEETIDAYRKLRSRESVGER